MPKSEEHHLAVVRLAPDDFAAKMDLAKVYFEQKKVADAAAQLEQVLKLDPQHAHERAYLNQLKAR
ncbi:MAG: cytochrome c-type biogenesis protein CcmH/NrfG [Verrucomicrobiales bacterium]